MAYVAMSRRYRPGTFDEVVGQEHVAQTLKNAIRTGRVAHAYLFCGPHGCGKTSMARIFAKALNCTGGPSADLPEDCPICQDISSGNDPDVMEIDGASNNSVDQVRTLREQAGYVPARARFKIYIIDEVHMLSGAAFNALLKTLEEPPPHVKFILATTEPHKLLDTVLSRCQRFDFRLVPPPLMAASLKKLCEREGVEAEPDALEAIAAFSGGSMRDGLVLLDQLISYCPEGIKREDVERVRGVAGVESVVAIFDAIAANDLTAAMNATDEVTRQGTGAGDFLDQLIEYGRDLMLYLASQDIDNLNTYGPAREAVARQSEALNLEKALLILDVFSTARVRVRSRALSNPLVPLEMAIARLAGLEGIDSVGNVIGRIEELAKSGALAGGADVVVAPVGKGMPVAAPATVQTEKTSESPSLATEGNSSLSAKERVEEIAPSPAAETPVENKNTHTAVESVPDNSASPVVADKAEAVLPPAQTLADRNAESAPAAPVPEDEHHATPNTYPYASGNKEGLTITLLQERWPELVNSIHETYPPDAAYFNDVMPLEVKKGNIIVLELPPGSVFLREKLEEPERRERIIDSLSHCLGCKVSLQLVLGEGAPPSDPQRNPSARREQRQQALSDPVVQDILSRFKGEVMNIE